MKVTCNFFLLLCLLGQAQPTNAQKTLADTTIITNGIRPIDLIKTNSHWNTATPDLFTFWIDNGLYGYYGPQPNIQLDGITVDANFFGWQNLDMLPLFMDDIKIIQSRYKPGVYHNSMSSSLINFVSHPPDTGLHASGSMYAGNETGDPGPWIYDSSRVTPNVDRWGPYGSGRISYHGKKWYGKGILTYRKTQPTDIRSHRRLQKQMHINDPQNFNPVVIINKSGLVEVGYSSDSWNIRGRGISGQSRDFLFLPAFGREVPTLNKYQQLALISIYNLQNWTIHTGYQLNHKNSDYRTNELKYHFNWSQLKHKIDVSFQYRSNKLKFKGGTALESIRTTAPGLESPVDKLFTIFTGLRFSINEGNVFRARGNVDINGTRFAKTVKLGAEIHPSKSWKASPSFIYSELLPIRQHSFSYWLGRGYTFDETLDIRSSGNFNISKNRLSTLGFKIRWIPFENFSISSNPEIIRHYDLMIPWQKVDYSPSYDAKPGTLSLTHESGSRLSLMGTVRHNALDFMNQKFSLRYQQTLSGTPRYSDYFEQVPDFSLKYRLDIQATDNLRFSTDVAYYSSRYWHEYEALEGRTYRSVDNLYRILEGTINPQTPSYIKMDISLRKWFWKRRLSLQCSLKNILNREVRMHPLGARLSTKFDIRITLRL